MPKKKPASEEKEKKLSMYTLVMTPEQMDKVKSYCEYHLWEAYRPDYTHFAFKNKEKKVNVVAYTSGKIVVSGKGTEDFVRDYIEAEVTYDPRMGYDEVHNPQWFESHAGLDEAGKGDLFGPVVCACVVADEAAIRSWIKAGVADSKTRTDSAILKLDKIIQGTSGSVSKVAYCSMSRYNELMAKPQANLNKLLAWLHARALQNAIKEKKVPWGLLDQFSKQPLVQKQLAKDGFEFDLKMQTKAESDPVVAAASICARAEFLRQMDRISEALGFEVPKGSGAPAKQKALDYVTEHGAESLNDYMKLHFKTAYEVRGLPVPEKKVWVK